MIGRLFVNLNFLRKKGVFPGFKFEITDYHCENIIFVMARLIQHNIWYLFLILLVFPLVVFGELPKTYTLIVGASHVNNSAYLHNYGRSYGIFSISGVSNDLVKIRKVAQQNRHILKELAAFDATKEKIINAIVEIGKKVKAGDQFFFYFSGHGDEVPDRNNDERSKFDQALVAYDDYVVDDTIYYLLKKYFTTTQNIMMVDACHSATMYKMMGDFSNFRRVLAGRASFLYKVAEKEEFSFLLDQVMDPVLTSEPFNLIYFGSTEDNGLSIGDINGGILTFWMDVVIRTANATGQWSKYTYIRLAQEVSAKLKVKNQNLQFHLVGEKVTNYVNKVPFKNY